MQNRSTSRQRATIKDKGRTTPAQSETTLGQPVPRLPHEHDESSDSQASRTAGQRQLGARSYADVMKGLVDTGQGPVMDKTYNEKVLPGASPAKFRRAAPPSSHQ